MATAKSAHSSNNDLSFEDADTASLIKLLDCPVCMEIPAPPIMMCKKGHNICESCRNLIPRCPICDEEFSTVRNFLAEELVEKLKRKCPNSKEGCFVVLKPKDWETHKTLCEFRQVECDLQQKKSCRETKLNYKNYWTHLKNIHDIQGVKATVLNVTQFVTFEQSGLSQELPRGYWPVQYMDACNEIFLTGTASVLGKIFWWVSIIGSEKDAEKYSARISLVMKSKGLETTWTGPVHSFRTSPETILAEGMCLLAIPETLLPYTHMKLQLNGNSKSGDGSNDPNVGWNIVYSVMKKEKLQLVNGKPSPMQVPARKFSSETLKALNTANTNKIPIGNPLNFSLSTLKLEKEEDIAQNRNGSSSNASPTSSSTNSQQSMAPVSMVRSRMKKGQSMGNLN